MDDVRNSRVSDMGGSAKAVVLMDRKHGAEVGGTWDASGHKLA